MTDPTPDYFNPDALIESAQHNLTDSRTRSQLFWAAAEIERLQKALYEMTELARTLRGHLLDQQAMPDYPEYSDDLLGPAR